MLDTRDLIIQRLKRVIEWQDNRRRSSSPDQGDILEALWAIASSIQELTDAVEHSTMEQ